MAEWRLDNASPRSNNTEILQSWNFDPNQQKAEHWNGRAIPGLSKDDATTLQRLEISDTKNLATRVEFPQPGNEKLTPLGRVNQMLDDNSQSTRWLKERGYLEAFKSENCTLELSFGNDRSGGKVGAVLIAPDGTKRTAVACENGTSFQRLTGPNGQELVKFLSSGQIIELNPYRAGGRTSA